jgi:hypothetical protein
MTKALTVYFIVLGVLCALSFSPAIVFFAAIFSGGVLGILIIASNTVLYYSVAFVPVLLTAHNKTLDKRNKMSRIAIALIVPATAAFAPAPLSKLQAEWFARSISVDDFNHPSTERPMSIEIASDDWLNAAAPNVRAPCNDTCQRLLFNHEVGWVRIVNLPFPNINANGRLGQPFAVNYSIEAGASCPEAYLPKLDFEQAVRDHLATGECLIATTDDRRPADAKLMRTTLFASNFDQRDPNYYSPPTVAPPWPLRSADAIIERFSVERRYDDGTIKSIMQRTKFQFGTLAAPFYFGYLGQMNIMTDGPVLGRTPFTINATDIAQALRSALGFTLGPVPPLDPASAAKMVEQIFSSPTKELFTTQQTGVINDAISNIANNAELTDADIAFVHRVIADSRVNDAMVGLGIQQLFRKFPKQMEPAIPLVLDRLAIPIPQQVGHYKSMLACALKVYQGDVLKPYRQQIERDRVLQPDSTTECLVTLY